MTDNNKQLDRRQVLAGLLPLLAGMPLLANAQTELTDLAKIRASGVLKVAVYKDNAPFSDGPANDVKGLDVSIATALARQLNLKLSLLPFDAGENMNDDLRNMVWRGHYLGYGPADVMLQVPGDKYLMARNRQVLILAPYMRQSLVLVFDTTRIADVSSPDDLKGFQLAAERGAGATPRARPLALRYTTIAANPNSATKGHGCSRTYRSQIGAEGRGCGEGMESPPSAPCASVGESVDMVACERFKTMRSGLLISAVSARVRPISRGRAVHARRPNYA